MPALEYKCCLYYESDTILKRYGSLNLQLSQLSGISNTAHFTLILKNNSDKIKKNCSFGIEILFFGRDNNMKPGKIIRG